MEEVAAPKPSASAQTKRIDIIPTPWVIIPALGLGVA